MTRTHWLVGFVLVVALLASNGWWFFVTLDQAVTDKYQEQMLWERQEALRDALKVIPLLAEGKREQEVVENIAAALEDPDWFEKEGLTKVGHLVFRFNEAGQLKSAGTTFGMVE